MSCFELPSIIKGCSCATHFLRLGRAGAAILLAGCLTVGCKKQESPPPPSPNVASPDQPAPSTAPPMSTGAPSIGASAGPVVVPDTGNVNATLHQLSLELRKFVVRTRTVPRTFEEFVAKTQAQIPPAPAGKKYKIEDQAVVLVNR